MSTHVVTYDVDDSTKVKFEFEPVDGFRPAGASQIVGRVQEAISPAVEAAKAVLDKVKEVRPDQVEVTFGVKVSGEATWFVAKSAAEGSFEITLTWRRDTTNPDPLEAGNATGTGAAASAPGAAG